MIFFLLLENVARKQTVKAFKSISVGLVLNTTEKWLAKSCRI